LPGGPDVTNPNDAGPPARRESVQATALPVEFRSAAGWRYIALGFAVLSGAAALWELAGGVFHGNGREVEAAGVTLLPALVAAVVLRRRVVVAADALVSVSLLRTRRIPWGSVRRLDQTRVSFLLYTDLGPVSAGLIAADARERLLRLVLQQAKLTAEGGQLRWGLVARYVPREQPITLGPRQRSG
jgi:hypothetical protein